MNTAQKLSRIATISYEFIIERSETEIENIVKQFFEQIMRDAHTIANTGLFSYDFVCNLNNVDISEKYYKLIRKLLNDMLVSEGFSVKSFLISYEEHKFLIFLSWET